MLAEKLRASALTSGGGGRSPCGTLRTRRVVSAPSVLSTHTPPTPNAPWLSTLAATLGAFGALRALGALMSRSSKDRWRNPLLPRPLSDELDIGLPTVSLVDILPAEIPVDWLGSYGGWPALAWAGELALEVEGWLALERGFDPFGEPLCDMAIFFASVCDKRRIGDGGLPEGGRFGSSGGFVACARELVEPLAVPWFDAAPDVLTRSGSSIITGTWMHISRNMEYFGKCKLILINIDKRIVHLPPSESNSARVFLYLMPLNFFKKS